MARQGHASNFKFDHFWRGILNTNERFAYLPPITCLISQDSCGGDTHSGEAAAPRQRVPAAQGGRKQQGSWLLLNPFSPHPYSCSFPSLLLESQNCCLLCRLSTRMNQGSVWKSNSREEKVGDLQ